MSLRPAVAKSADPERFFGETLADGDPEIFAAIGQELARQQSQIELIASENIVSAAVLEAQGSVLTNKYAEGYPGKRYYGGCEFGDIAGRPVFDRAKRPLRCRRSTPPPHSRAPAAH